MRLFFYGTLRDSDVRARVLGRHTAALHFIDAVAPGFRAMFAAGRDFPVLVPGHGAKAPGLLVSGFTRRGLRRLIAYEGGDYRLGRIRVVVAGHKPVVARVFLPRRYLRIGWGVFDLGHWQAGPKERYLKMVMRNSSGSGPGSGRSFPGRSCGRAVVSPAKAHRRVRPHLH